MSQPDDSGRTQLPVASAARTRSVLGRLLRAHRLLALTTLAALTLRAGVGLIGPALLGLIVDRVVDGASADTITAPFLGLLAVAIAEAGLAVLGGIMMAQLGEGLLTQLREQVVDRTLALPLEQVERAGTGDLLSRVSGDVALVSEATRTALPTLVSSALTVGLTFGGLFVLDWRLALAGLLAAPIQLHTLRWYLGRSGPVYAEERVVSAERTHQLFDSFDGAATVRAFGLIPSHTALVERRSLAAAELAIRATWLRTRFFGRLNLAEFVGLAAILLVGFLLVGEETVSIGTVTAAALYFLRLFDPFNALLFLIDEAQRAGAALARLVGVVDIPLPPGPSAPADPLDASVEMHMVDFGYGAGPDVVSGLCLRIESGERVAVVGTSGAGKTTLAKLVAGIHPARSGSIRVGGVAIEQIDDASGARTAVMVSQEVHVFLGSLAADLRLARPEASDDDLRAALVTVGALNWVDELPDGLDTMVGAGGHRLDATRAQQLALARLVLADPRVAILDEASAEAGSSGARVLEAAAARAVKDRTALVVAHRLTQAADADRIVVLHAGRIVESGTHADLVAAGGPYAGLWRAWVAERPSHDGTDQRPNLQ